MDFHLYKMNQQFHLEVQPKHKNYLYKKLLFKKIKIKIK